jgi:hypothetical protein
MAIYVARGDQLLRHWSFGEIRTGFSFFNESHVNIRDLGLEILDG